MPRLSRAPLFVAAMLLSAATLVAQSDRPATGLWQCDTNMGGRTIYATRYFEWTGLGQELHNAFQQYLLSAHGYKERANCRMASPGGMTVAQLDADMQRQHSQFRSQGFQVVAVPWTIRSPGVTLAYSCFGVAQVRRAGMADSTYVLGSKVFRIPEGRQGELSTTWIAHLKSLHPDWYFQGSGCVLLPADPAEHQPYIDRHVAMYERFKPSVTQLDWEYRPGSGAPAEPRAQPAQPPTGPPAAAAWSLPDKPPVDRFGRPIPPQTFFCQYLGMARDASGKYPLYRNELFTVAAMAGTLQNGFRAYIESTYHPTAPGNSVCASMPNDPAQREAAMRSVNMLTQPGSQVVVNVAWKP